MSSLTCDESREKLKLALENERDASRTVIAHLRSELTNALRELAWVREDLATSKRAVADLLERLKRDEPEEPKKAQPPATHAKQPVKVVCTCRK